MTVVNILIAAAVLGLMGLLFGLLLMGTEKVFAIPADEKRDAVRAALPGANCGACGYPGCDGCADAIACGKAPVNACPVGGKPVADKISAIMGNAEAADAVRKVASVICQGDSEHCKEKFEYRGIWTAWLHPSSMTATRLANSRAWVWVPARASARSTRFMLTR